MKHSTNICALLLFFTCGLSSFAPSHGQLAGSRYRQTNLASDVPKLAAHTQLNLKNPVGITLDPKNITGIDNNFFLMCEGATVAQLLLPSGALDVHKILPGNSLPFEGDLEHGIQYHDHPTGAVFNDVKGEFPYFGGIGEWIFATDEGTLNGWNTISTQVSFFSADNSVQGAVYKGVAVLRNLSGAFAVATNFNSGNVDVFTDTRGGTALSGNFVDSQLPAGYAAFGIRRVSGKLFVTYAVQDLAKKNPVTGAGRGLIDEFDLNGNLIRRFASPGGVLNAPWGMALAPATGFGTFSGALLVGNFGNGKINAFDLKTGKLLGTLSDSNGKPLVNEGLWDLHFGQGTTGAPTTLFFTAGIGKQMHGLFGSITAAQ